MQLLRMGPGGGPPAAPASSRSWQSGTCLSGRFAARPAGGRAAGQATTTVSPERDLWWDFAESAAGEWEGVTATFTPDGKPKPLPDYYVPEAYRDWEVTLYDWQSQCSVWADEASLSMVHRRMMPTVGCEADAIAFTEDGQQLFPADGGSNTIAADGSYSTGPLDLSSTDHTAAFQHCLGLGQGQRIRVVHKLQRMGTETCWRVAEIEVHREQWDGPWTGKLELSGCGGGMDGFAQSPALDSSALEGSWTASGVQYSISASSGQCTTSEVQQQPWSPANVPSPPVCLPLGLWSSAAVDSHSISIYVGALREDGSWKVGSRRLAAGVGTEVELFTLTKPAGFLD